ncbi:hypothetical protein [Streptomyces pinistramenti]|uniref:hypothetical protein n=1 Tax=Streptomyces pinistramenti TaxID=2884812 RepID=UPI001D08D01F|nr:hypothetical protein [Streptomyces pinistramenti]MCB5909479.1 hypothetical protein [Streptomyces pinistramenti]
MRRLIAVPTVLLALAAAGCTGGRATDTSAAASDGPGAQNPSSAGPTPTIPGRPVDCGEIRDALGTAESVTLFADPGAGGTVKCEEAHDVMADFFRRAPQDSGDDPGSLAVRGWLCQYESGPTGTWISSCHKNRLEMHTEEASGEGTGPGSSDEPSAPDESRLPPLPDEPSSPMDEPSTEEL